MKHWVVAGSLALTVIIMSSGCSDNAPSSSSVAEPSVVSVEPSPVVAEPSVTSPRSEEGSAQHGISLYGPSGLKYGPGEPYVHANVDAPKGGTLQLPSMGAFTKLNPQSLKGTAAPGLGLVFETLVDGSEDGDEPFSQYGLLAERIQLADDRMSITFHLHPEARFSDGEPLTADDVVFSFNLIHDPDYVPFYRAYYADVDAAEKLDSHVVRFRFRTYNQELPLIIGQLPIMPKHVYGVEGKTFGADFDTTAIGSGPYVVAGYDPGKYVLYKRNPNWWGANLAINRGRFNFDEIRYRVYLDPVAWREALKGGEVDAAQINSSKDWATEYNGDFFERGYMKRGMFPHDRVSGMQCFAFNLRKPMFQSIKLRKAIASVFDFDFMNREHFYGQYVRQVGYFDNNPEMMSRGPAEGEVKEHLEALRNKYNDRATKTVHVYRDAITIGPYNVGQTPGETVDINARIAAANRLLDAEGWLFDKEAGGRVKDGQRLAFDILISSGAWQRLVNPFTENLAKIGIQARYKLVQPAEYRKKVKSFDYDMIIANFAQSLSPGNEQRDMWMSESADVPGSRNVVGIKNPAVDEAVESLIAARTRADLVAWVQVLDRILCSNHYVIPHWYISYDRAVYWNRFSRPSQYASKVGFESNLINWWWFDDAKASRLQAAQAAGVPMTE